MQVKLFLVVLVVVGFVEVSADCGDSSTWIAVGPEKCIRVLDEFLAREEASNICRNISNNAFGAGIVTIKSSAEQNFIANYLFEELGLLDNAWLDGDRHNLTTFKWSDGTAFLYSNWEPGHPTNVVQNGCLQLSSSVGNHKADAGLWRDVPCNKTNLVVCQKLPTLTIDELSAMVLDIRANPVPMGFIYTQLSGKPSPQTIWPTLSWKNVTDEYAGQFFRAFGGNSAPFGNIQQENSVRLGKVNYEDRLTYTDPKTITLPAQGASAWLQAGAHTSPDWNHFEGLKFELTTGENRPLNSAVLIWERV